MPDLQQQIWDLNAQENIKQLDNDSVYYIYQLLSQYIPEVKQYIQQLNKPKVNASKGVFINPNPINIPNINPSDLFSNNTFTRLNARNTLFQEPKLNVDFNIGTQSAESKLMQQATKGISSDNWNLNGSPQKTFTQSLKNIGNTALSSGAGLAAGWIVGQGADKIFGDSKVGQMASGIASQAASTVAQAGMQAALKSGQSFTSTLGNSVGSTAGLLNIGAGIGNLALDVLDPVKKSKAEIYGGLGASLAIGLINPFAGLTMLGLNAVNHLTGKKGNTFTINTDTLEKVGSEYTDTVQDIYKARSLSGQKYSGANSSERKDDNRFKDQVRLKQEVMTDVADTATTNFLLENSMQAINNNKQQLDLQGDMGYTYIGRKGLKMQNVSRAKSIINNKNQEDPFDIYLNSLPDNQKYSTNYRVRDYWEFNGKPKDFKEALQKEMFILGDDGVYHAPSIQKNPKTGEIEYMKASNHPTRYMESDWYEKGLIYTTDKDGNVHVIQLVEGTPEYDDWKKFTNEYELIKSEPYWKYVKRDNIISHKQGGTFIKIPTTICLQEGGQLNTDRDINQLIDYAKEQNPRFVQRMSEPLKYVEWQDNGKTYWGTHELSYSEIDGKYVVYPNIQEGNDGNLVRYNDSRDAINNALRNNDVLWLNSQNEAELFTNSGQLDDGTLYGYKIGWPDFFNQSPSKFQKGGSINVIPDGALHARKHNMDMEGITKKGIPVVSENENGGIIQQAEIEQGEIIFRISTTNKIEELCNKYYSENISQKDKDTIALEAGKLLVNEILYNTQDNTNNLI